MAQAELPSGRHHGIQMQRLLHCPQVPPERKAKTAEKYFSWTEFNLYIRGKDSRVWKYSHVFCNQIIKHSSMIRTLILPLLALTGRSASKAVFAHYMVSE